MGWWHCTVTRYPSHKEIRNRKWVNENALFQDNPAPKKIRNKKWVNENALLRDTPPTEKLETRNGLMKLHCFKIPQRQRN